MEMSNELMDADIIIVEPSVAQSKVLEKALHEFGIYNIRAFNCADKALDAMRLAPPSLVISSMYLEDMTGAELVHKMRTEEDTSDIAFMLISSERRTECLEAVRQSGTCGILHKPFECSQLRKAIETALKLANHHEEKDTEFDGDHKRVLVVDDMGMMRKYIRKTLEFLGFHDILEAENGRVAIDILENEMIDLIVTDYNMPEVDGLELVKYVRESSWQSSVPILMVTSETNTVRLAGIENAGVSGICDKPFHPDTVSHLLHSMLDEEEVV